MCRYAEPQTEMIKANGDDQNEGENDHTIQGHERLFNTEIPMYGNEKQRGNPNSCIVLHPRSKQDLFTNTRAKRKEKTINIIQIHCFDCMLKF